MTGPSAFRQILGFLRLLALDFIAQFADDPVHARLTGRGERIKVKPPARTGRCASGECLEHMAAAANAAVANDIDLAANRVGDFGNLVERRP